MCSTFFWGILATAKWGSTAFKESKMYVRLTERFQTFAKESLHWTKKGYINFSEMFRLGENEAKWVTQAETKYVYNMVENPGPLSEMRGNLASNFISSKYNVKVLDEDIILYRSGKKGGLIIPGQEQNVLRQCFTREPVESAVKV
ncbi:hypothetical protein SAMN02745163_01666 [Clostridium cavendishii DSM 21758]|uniref:Uncharacterized protein n=1 Tax=Clostridium cavendishii DSM 21758 TaxID=1121302 RepID=A0A1M6I1Z4_9CLOT|nr:hypothetical protein [Clostridium cavendishii]SHJ28477.1 hypothetical protein SAMN02745163_01666 [Clostridium cavendishii DSM 21758]